MLNGDVAVVIPAKDEAQRIRATVTAAAELPGAGLVVVVDDGSVDGTAAVARDAGAVVRFFSPLADEPPLEDCDVCWLPGGYPELHAGRLAAAERFQAGLRAFARTRPVHGECGGYMVLGQTLVDAAGVAHRMAGLIGASFSFAKRRMNLGYRDVTLAADCCLGENGARLRGHEFHYATMIENDVPDLPLVMARDAQGGAPTPAGSRRGTVSGSFFHVVARAV